MDWTLKNEILPKRRNIKIWVYDIKVRVKNSKAKRKSKRANSQQQKRCISYLQGDQIKGEENWKYYYQKACPWQPNHSALV